MADDTVIAEMVIKIKELENRLQRLEGLILTSQPGHIKELAKKKMSIKEFLLSKMPKDDPQKTLAIAYFFEKYQGMASFNVADIEKGYRDSKEKPPQNINDKVNKNITKGYLMEAAEKKDSKKAWMLTNSGELLVEHNFQEE